MIPDPGPGESARHDILADAEDLKTAESAIQRQGLIPISSRGRFPPHNATDPARDVRGGSSPLGSSFPALLVLPSSQERCKCSSGRVEDEWLVTRPHAPLDLEQATGRGVDDDPPHVSTLDAAALFERNWHAGPGGLLGLREPAGFRELAVFVQGRSSMGSRLVSFRPGWVLITPPRKIITNG